MAWNIPGGNKPDNDNGGGRRDERPQRAWNPRGGRGGGRGGDPLSALRERFGGGFGGGGIGRWLLLAAALWLAMTSFVLIAEQQRGVVLRLGQMHRVMTPGPNLKLPWPLERVIKVNTTQIKTFDSTVPVLTRDENIVNVEINVQYRIADARQYLFGTRGADNVLEQAALSTVREQVGRAPLDTVLGARAALAVSARENLQRSLEVYRTGIEVTELTLPNARPPEEVKPAFDDVNSAEQERNRLISEAQAYAAKIVPEARGEAARTRTVAEGYRTATIARANGDAERFTQQVDAYRSAPEVTRKRLWLETVEQVLAENRKVVGGDGRQLIYVPMAGANAGSAAPQQPLLPAEVVDAAGNAATPQPPQRSTPRPDGRQESNR